MNDHLAELLTRAEALAKSAHQDQACEDGRPYITHVKGVVDGVEDPGDKVIAWLHDVVEDQPSFEPLVRQFPQWVIDGVLAITHPKREPVWSYIARILSNERATRVKVADLKHNLSDQKPGNRKDKYQLMLRLLSHPDLARSVLEAYTPGLD